MVMELAGQITAMEYAPDFLMKDEYFCVDRQGKRDECSLGYGYLNFNHPEVRELIREQYGAAARAYREFPALRGYDIWNETQFTSFDEHTLTRFRGWLREKYGSLDAANDSWDRAYRSWEEIRFTQWMWASVMAFVDYQQFHKANIGMILRDMRRAIEAEDMAHEILADNIHASVAMDHHYDRPSDDWGVAREVDQYGISFYPKLRRRSCGIRLWWEPTALHRREGLLSPRCRPITPPCLIRRGALLLRNCGPGAGRRSPTAPTA